jgi:hypothetical protein
MTKKARRVLWYPIQAAFGLSGIPQHLTLVKQTGMTKGRAETFTPCHRLSRRAVGAVFTGNEGWVPHSSRFWLEWDTTALDAPSL